MMLSNKIEVTTLMVRCMKLLMIPQLLLLVCILGNSACSVQKTERSHEPFDKALTEALGNIGLTREYLALPKLGQPYSTPGRLTGVDVAMSDPVSMVTLSRRLSQIDAYAPPSVKIAQLLTLHGLKLKVPPPHPFVPSTANDVWNEMLKASVKNENVGKAPAEWDKDEPLYRALRLLLYEEAMAQQTYRQAGGNPTNDEFLSIQKHLQGLIRNKEPRPEEQRWLIPAAYHQIGARVNLADMASAMVRLQMAIEEAMPDL